MKIILTGATGMVGEGVMLECLATDDVEKTLADPHMVLLEGDARSLAHADSGP